MVVWWGTPVEIAAALARLLKVKEIDVDEWRRVNTLTRRLADNWSVVGPTEALLRRAVALVEVYDLRAPDALQLAAALEWCEGRPNNDLFVSFDKRLRDAALMSGFHTPS
jgi:predicted nucleic acid-binding protein